MLFRYRHNLTHFYRLKKALVVPHPFMPMNRND